MSISCLKCGSSFREKSLDGTLRTECPICKSPLSQEGHKSSLSQEGQSITFHRTGSASLVQAPASPVRPTATATGSPVSPAVAAPQEDKRAAARRRYAEELRKHIRPWQALS